MDPREESKQWTEERLGEMERLLMDSVRYAIAIKLGYGDHLSEDRWRRHVHDIFALEAWYDYDPKGLNEAGGGIDRMDDDYAAGKRYGKHEKFEVKSSGGTVKNFKQWMKMETGEIATKGLQGFLNNTQKLMNVVGGWIRTMKIKIQLKRLPDPKETLDELYVKIEQRHDQKMGKPTTAVVPDVSLLIKRLDGYLNIVQTIHDFAENSDADAFDSDKTWDQFASSSNRALKARPPKNGMFFRELERVMPYEHTVDLMKSDWHDKNATNQLAEKIAECKESVMVKIQDELKFIKKLVDGLESEVSHVQLKYEDRGGQLADNTMKQHSVGPYTTFANGDQGEEVVVKYARGYVAAKFVQQLQDMFVEELTYILKAIPKKIMGSLAERAARGTRDAITGKNEQDYREERMLHENKDLEKGQAHKHDEETNQRLMEEGKKQYGLDGGESS